MKPKHHVMISTGVSLIFWWWFKSIPGTISCFLSGILIDLDHHIDYWLIKRKIPWNYNDLKAYFYKQEFSGGSIYLFFHAYEWLIFLWAGIYFWQLDAVWIGLGIGLTTHLIADEIYNPIRPFGYFLLFRLSHRFQSDIILKDH